MHGFELSDYRVSLIMQEWLLGLQGSIQSFRKTSTSEHFVFYRVS